MNIKQLCGWTPRPDEVKRVLSTKTNPTFGQAAPHLANIWQQEEIGLWRSSKMVNGGKHLPADKQTIGDCVSHGYSRGLDYLWCVKQSAGLIDGYVEGQTSAMSEYVYGVAREAGGELGPQDGSCGISAVNGIKTNGYVFREGVAYDGQKAKQYGWRGVPADMKPKGKGHLLTDYAQLSSPQDMANALKAGSTCPICTALGFSMQRDANGVCRQEGRWGHCMVVIGLYKVSSNWVFVILQSWGQNTPSGPAPVGGEAPDNSFGCSWDDMGRILSEGDSYALTGMTGWEPVPVVNWVM